MDGGPKNCSCICQLQHVGRQHKSQGPTDFNLRQCHSHCLSLLRLWLKTEWSSTRRLATDCANDKTKRAPALSTGRGETKGEVPWNRLVRHMIYHSQWCFSIAQVKGDKSDPVNWECCFEGLSCRGDWGRYQPKRHYDSSDVGIRSQRQCGVKPED